jgi:hypothetical protein
MKNFFSSFMKLKNIISNKMLLESGKLEHGEKATIICFGVGWEGKE